LIGDNPEDVKKFAVSIRRATLADDLDGRLSLRAAEHAVQVSSPRKGLMSVSTSFQFSERRKVLMERKCLPWTVDVETGLD